jgi:hypothetical protein
MIELSNADIDKTFAKYKNYGGCFSKNQLGKLQNKFYILNMEDSNVGSGTHWICVHNSGKQCIYYDSFGAPPPQIILKRMLATKKDIKYNCLQIQDLNSIMCGYYCVDACKRLELKEPFENILDDYNENTKNNEKIIHKYSIKNHVISGSGLYSTIKAGINGIKNIGRKIVSTAIVPVTNRIFNTSQGPRDRATERFNNFLDENEDNKVVKITVARKPIIKGVKILLNGLSGGKFGKTEKNLGYDDTYHNYMIYELANGESYKVEKNHVVEHTKAKSADYDHEKYDIPINGRDLNLKEMLSNAEKKEGRKRLYQYDGSGDNCQRFVQSVIDDNGLSPTDEKAKELIKPQRADLLMDSLGSIRPIGKITTDIAGTLDRLYWGDGLINKGKKK